MKQGKKHPRKQKVKRKSVNTIRRINGNNTPPGFHRAYTFSFNPILVISGVAAGVAVGKALVKKYSKSDLDAQIEEHKKEYQECSNKLYKLQNLRNSKSTQTSPTAQLSQVSTKTFYPLLIGGSFFGGETKQEQEGKKLAILNHYQNAIKECKYQIGKLKK